MSSVLHPLQGHEPERAILARAVRLGTLPSSLLFHGARGVGKQRLALWTAQLLLCEAQGVEPCDSCRSCKLALGLQHPDVHWHFPLVRPKGVNADKLGDALEHARYEALADRRVGPVRYQSFDEPAGIYVAAVQALRRRAHTRPAMGREQIFIVGDADALVSQEASPEAANALLKLLEEPPNDTRFILTSSEPGRLLPTVRSRTVPLHVGTLPTETVLRFLIDVAGFERADAEKAARLGAGSIGRALGFLPDEAGTAQLDKMRGRAREILRAALTGRRQDAFQAAMGFPPTGARALVELMDFLDESLRDLAAISAGSPERAADPDAAALFAKALEGATVDPVDAARGLAAVERARELARGNVNPQLLVFGLVEELRRLLRGRTRSAARAGARP